MKGIYLTSITRKGHRMEQDEFRAICRRCEYSPTLVAKELEDNGWTFTEIFGTDLVMTMNLNFSRENCP